MKSSNKLNTCLARAAITSVVIKYKKKGHKATRHLLGFGKKLYLLFEWEKGLFEKPTVGCGADEL